jgi:hypothetical protein
MTDHGGNGGGGADLDALLEPFWKAPCPWCGGRVSTQGRASRIYCSEPCRKAGSGSRQRTFMTREARKWMASWRERLRTFEDIRGEYM